MRTASPGQLPLGRLRRGRSPRRLCPSPQRLGDPQELVEPGGGWNGFTSEIRRYLDDQLSVYILADRTNLDLGTIMKAAVDAYR